MRTSEIEYHTSFLVWVDCGHARRMGGHAMWNHMMHAVRCSKSHNEVSLVSRAFASSWHIRGLAPRAAAVAHVCVLVHSCASLLVGDVRA